MQLKGTILKIKDVQVISDKFKKQEVILKQADTEYDADVPVEFMQDKGIELVKGLKVGQNYEISINISGREWKDRHFVSLKAWKVEKLEGFESEQPTSSADDSLPF